MYYAKYILVSTLAIFLRQQLLLAGGIGVRTCTRGLEHKPINFCNGFCKKKVMIFFFKPDLSLHRNYAVSEYNVHQEMANKG